MEDKNETLHGIRKTLEVLYDESSGELSDLVRGMIFGVAVSDGIVNGDISIADEDNFAIGLIAAVTLYEVLPESSIDRIEKMLS